LCLIRITELKLRQVTLPFCDYDFRDGDVEFPQECRNGWAWITLPAGSDHCLRAMHQSASAVHEAQRCRGEPFERFMENADLGAAVGDGLRNEKDRRRRHLSPELNYF